MMTSAPSTTAPLRLTDPASAPASVLTVALLKLIVSAVTVRSPAECVEPRLSDVASVAMSVPVPPSIVSEASKPLPRPVTLIVSAPVSPPVIVSETVGLLKAVVSDEPEEACVCEPAAATAIVSPVVE